MVIILMAIGGYYINGYQQLFYWWVFGDYFKLNYHMLLMTIGGTILLMVIGGYFIMKRFLKTFFFQKNYLFLNLKFINFSQSTMLLVQ